MEKSTTYIDKKDSLLLNNTYIYLDSNYYNTCSEEIIETNDNDLNESNDSNDLNESNESADLPVEKLDKKLKILGFYPKTKNSYKNIFCVNCGEKGHVVKECTRPITSFGIISFKIVENEEMEKFDKNDELINILGDNNDNSKEYPKIKFLMIQRKDTMGYIDFLRGKYPMESEEEKLERIKICLSEMTFEEKNSLLTKSFDRLWSDLWINHSSKCFKNEYLLAKKKFEMLDIKSLVENSTTIYEHSELGFAKGRRNMKECNIMCAEREFFEETGYDKTSYEFIKNYPMIQEEFTGTNGIEYKHIYFLVKMKNNVKPPKIDNNNKIQTGEVKNIGWFTIDECLHLIRPYDDVKKQVISKVYEDIKKMNGKYECSVFYKPSFFKNLKKF